MKNWKTTAVGVLTIIGAIVTATIEVLNTGSVGGGTVTAIVTAVGAGITGILAKDNSARL
jgi:hypothetical protein